MARKVVVQLTVPQAVAACRALGFALAGEADEVFEGAGSYGSARRAHAALSRAVEEAGGWEQPSQLEMARAAAERAGIDPSIIREREDGGLVIDVPLAGGAG